MANQVKLSARPRLEAGRNAVGKVRARGAVPAVIYGSRDAATNLEVDRKEIENLLSRAVGENILVELEIRDGTKTTNRISLIQEVQHHPVRGEIIHVDFHAVSLTEEIEAEIVIESEGEPVGVKTFNGLLQQSMRSLPIRCLPQNLPEIIVVDVSSLNIGESLHVRDLKLPPGVTAEADEDLTVFLVSEPTVAEEPAAEAEEPAAPEVIKEKKPEASEAAGEPANSLAGARAWSMHRSFVSLSALETQVRNMPARATTRDSWSLTNWPAAPRSGSVSSRSGMPKSRHLAGACS